jgi:hypothetical protein
MSSCGGSIVAAALSKTATVANLGVGRRGANALDHPNRKDRAIDRAMDSFILIFFFLQFKLLF